jgi:hypothetical protein
VKARDNPLATHRVLAIRYRPLDMTWTQLLDRLRELNYRAAIVGPKGTGKTTLIEDLANRLAARGLAPRLIHLTAEHHVIPRTLLDDLAPEAIVLVDGAEQLSWARWIALKLKTRRARGLIVTMHRPGRLPPLLHTATTPKLLNEIAAELLTDRAPHRERIDELFICHHGNIRDALRELYDHFAAIPG